ncbi:hypothetical protein NP233_g2704 [Leucocoprinus birnbaumii]|uniref:Uncharacterized protein n=1 Tax=Leucocoprinus birnbaumii TaxID=56174 RepID=A0AAD5VZW6_9AGAR|nr:hypothetical protein NP233_g2704 [Leucocoprinus birnbaumii]
MLELAGGREASNQGRLVKVSMNYGRKLVIGKVMMMMAAETLALEVHGVSDPYLAFAKIGYQRHRPSFGCLRVLPAADVNGDQVITIVHESSSATVIALDPEAFERVYRKLAMSLSSDQLYSS